MATQQVVNVGAQANDATGDLLRDAFTKINNNFAVFFAGNFPTAQMTVGPPVSGTALTIVGLAGQNSISTTGFAVTTAGSVLLGAPTGGAQGLGTINATGVFVNGVAVATGGVSSFTSNTGLSANIAATGAVTVTNTGVLSVTTNTGLSSNVSATGAVTVTNTGVTSLAGTANQIAASTSTGAVTLTLPQNLIIPTPASGIAIQVTGATNNTALTVQAGTGQVGIVVTGTAGAFASDIFQVTTAGSSFGLQVRAGTNASDLALLISNASNTATFLEINGNGSGSLGPSSSLGFSWLAAGNIAISAPTSGDNLLLTNVAGGNALTITGNSAGTAVLRLNTQATTGAQSVILSITNKPGASAQTQPAKWLPINLDGTTYLVPAFL